MNEQVFISYSSKDRKWAAAIADTLEGNGIHCWIDKNGIRPGECYDDEIIAAIQKCPVFLLVLTENAESSKYVPKELGLAINEDKTIIPVRITDFELKRFRLKLENIQIYELGKSWAPQRIEFLVNDIRMKLDLVPVRQKSISSAPVKTLSGGGRWKKRVAAACMFVVLGAVVVSIFWNALSQGEGVIRSVMAFLGGTDEEDVPGGENAADDDSGGFLSDLLGDISEKDQTVKLTKMHIMESECAGIREDAVNSIGQTYDEALYLWGASFGRPYATYYLGGEYSLFTGTLSCPDDVVSGYTYKFQIFLDGDEDEPAFEMKMGRSTGPTPLEINVAGCQTITFNIDTVGSVGAMIPDGLLYGKDADVAALSAQTASAEPSDPVQEKNQTVKLTKMHIMESEFAEIREDAANSAGQIYDEALYLCARSFGRPYATYYLGGEYSLFTGTVSCPDDVDSGFAYKFQVFLDGNEDEPAFEIEMSRSTGPAPLVIDVAGCQTITFNIDTGGSVGAMIPDGLLYGKDADISALPAQTAPAEPSDSAQEKNQTVKLTKMHIMESEFAEIRKDAVDSVGETYDEALYLCARAFGRPYATYYLGGEYSLFTGTVSCPDEVGSGSAYKFQIFLDGNEDEPAFEMEMGRSTGPTPLEIDVSGCQTITFNIDTGGSVGAVIPDGIFTK